VADRQGQTGSGLGDVLPQDQYSIEGFHLPQRRRAHRPPLQDVAYQGQASQFGCLDPAGEVLGAHQFPQGKVGFQAGPWRADTHYAPGMAQGVGGIGDGVIRCEFNPGFALAREWLAWAVRPVDIAVAEAAAIAEEIVVHGAVVAVLDAAQFAVAFAGADRKSTRLNSSHVKISYAVFCLKKKILTPSS